MVRRSQGVKQRSLQWVEQKVFSPRVWVLFGALAADRRTREYSGVFTTVNLDQGGEVPASVHGKAQIPALNCHLYSLIFSEGG